MTERSEAVPAGENESGAGAARPRSSSQDDMIDMPSDFQHWPFLHQVLGECRDSLVALYLQSDKAARDEQRIHRVWVISAAVAATMAVCLAILQLALSRNAYMSGLEMVAVVTAALSFWKGERSRERWLTERHITERCRFLKFSSIIRPDNWMVGGLSSGDCATELGAQTEKVSRMRFRDVKKWLNEDKLPSPPGRILAPNLKQLTELRDYYHEKRATFQVHYFQKQWKRDVKWDERWRAVPHWLFAGSFAFVAVHAVIEVANRFIESMNRTNPKTESPHWVEILLTAAIAGAALLPVISSGIRIWRSANEATRNISRFRAKFFALDNIKDQLERYELKDTAEAESLLRDLWCAEQIMESEHREWLRLMIDAEWLG